MNLRNFKRKMIIIINGKGGCGKDTLVKFAINEYENVWNKSAIDPIKDIAKQYGYKDDEKSDKARKFLSDLKRVFVNWNNMPTDYLVGKAKEFYESDSSYSQIMFVHIREPEEINKFKEAIKRHIGDDENKLVVKTMLVKSKTTDDKNYGNASDDCVENYTYDFVFYNYKDIYAAKYDFLLYMEEYVIPYLLADDISTVKKPSILNIQFVKDIDDATYNEDEKSIKVYFKNGSVLTVPIVLDESMINKNRILEAH